MNDKTERNALNEIFEELQDFERESQLVEEADSVQSQLSQLSQLSEQLFEPEDQAESDAPAGNDQALFEEIMGGAGAMGLEDGMAEGENPMDDLFDGDLDEEIPPVGFNWQAVVFGFLLVISIVAFLINFYGAQ